VIETLRQQLQQLDAGQVRVVQADAAVYLRGGGQPFDIVFLDPPFGEGLLVGIMQQLEAGGWLTADAWVYLEAERGQVYELPPNWSVHRSKTAGQVAYSLVRRTAAAPAD
jgi:16S rRNA (guanine966-N2)-methyltransferase